MKHHAVFKTFSALSFKAHGLAVEEPMPTADSAARLMPHHARDFQTRQDRRPNGDCLRNDGLGTGRPRQQRVLLLLSSEPCFQESVRGALPRQIELMPAQHAEHAIRLAEETWIDAILLDLDLEFGEGWRTAGEFLSNDPTVRLLLAVEPKNKPELIAGVRAGVVLEKPMHATRFAEMLDTAHRQTKHQRFQHNLNLHNFLRYAQPLSWSSRTTVSQLR